MKIIDSWRFVCMASSHISQNQSGSEIFSWQVFAKQIWMLRNSWWSLHILVSQLSFSFPVSKTSPRRPVFFFFDRRRKFWGMLGFVRPKKVAFSGLVFAWPLCMNASPLSFLPLSVSSLSLRPSRQTNTFPTPDGGWSTSTVCASSYKKEERTSYIRNRSSRLDRHRSNLTIFTTWLYYLDSFLL